MEHPKTTPKDFFLYAFAAGAMYFSATTLITLLWQLINYWLPDTQSYGYYTMESVSSLLRWSIALLIIVFPAYVAAMWWIGKDVDRVPAKAELWVRRWFIWATLFVAAVTLLGDLVYLVYTLLGGDVAPRFILKALSVGVVAAAVFGYHWYLLRRAPGAGQGTRKVLAIVASAVVGVAIIAGFAVAGSPSSARAARFDMERVNHLQGIQWQVTDYWQRKQELPTEINQLIDTANPMPLPVDPRTGEAYKYEKRSTYEFALCANFETNVDKTDIARQAAFPVEEGLTFAGQPATWEHGMGEQCFVRTIDPDRYPPLNEKRVM